MYAYADLTDQTLRFRGLASRPTALRMTSRLSGLRGTQEKPAEIAGFFTLCRPEPMVDGDCHLFLSLYGYPMTESTVQKICYRLSKRSGVHIYPHRFRHTFAVNMLRAGTDLRTLQRLMGHADIRNLTRYLNLVSDEAIEAHQSNSPADRYHQQLRMGDRRLPIHRHYDSVVRRTSDW